jgi:hypothetical protein
MSDRAKRLCFAFLIYAFGGVLCWVSFAGLRELFPLAYAAPLALTCPPFL